MRYADNATDYILTLCQLLCPCDEGDEPFEWMAKDFGGSGTTCGFLPSAVMYALGVRDRIVNRSEPEAGLVYRPGANISAIFNQGKHPSILFQRGMQVPPGSIFFVSNGPPTTEHVGILWKIEQGVWHTFDAGQQNAQGKECMRARRRTFLAGALDGRKLVSFIPPDNLKLTAEPLDYTKLFSEAWWPKPARDPYTGKSVLHPGIRPR